MNSTSKRLGQKLMAGLAGAAWWFSGCLNSPAAAAATNSPAAQAAGNRYLIIVESSKAMEKRQSGVAQVVQDLIGSGFKGQARRGDTLGVWTYNDRLYTGQFALQTLTPETQKAVGADVARYLSKIKYERQPKFAKVIPTLAQLVTDSYLLTVIVISSGTEDLQGTPFDGPINDGYHQWREQQQSKRMPFVTLLRGHRGRVTQYALATAPWPLEFPQMPPGPRQEIAAKTKAPPPAPKPAPAVAQPLIVSGKKTSAAAAAVSEPARMVQRAESETNALAQLPPAISSAQTNEMLAQPQVQAAEVKSGPAPATSVVAAVSAGTTPVEKTTSQEPSPGVLIQKPVSQPTALAQISEQRKPAETEDKPKVTLPAETNSATAPAVAPLPITAAFSRSSLQLAMCGAAGLFVLALAVGLVHHHKTRQRASRPISLITRSLDRQVP